MAFTWPSINTIRNVIKGVITNYADSPNLSKGSKWWIISEVLSKLVWQLHATGQRVLKRAHPYTSSDEQLDYWAKHYGLPDGSGGEGRLKPHRSSGNDVVYITLTAVGLCSAGTRFQDASGLQFELTETKDGSVLGAGNYLVNAQSVDTGFATNIESGTTIELIDSPSGVSLYSTETQSDMDGGADEETDSALRARMNDHVSRPSLCSNTTHIRRVVEAAGTGGNFEAFVYPGRWQAPSGIGSWDCAPLQRNESGTARICTANQIATISGACIENLGTEAVTHWRLLDVVEKDTDGSSITVNYTISPGSTAQKYSDWDAETTRYTVAIQDHSTKAFQANATISGTLDVGDRVYIAGNEATVTGWFDDKSFFLDGWPWEDNDTSCLGCYIMAGGGLTADICQSVLEYVDSLGTARGTVSGTIHDYADNQKSWVSTMQVQRVQKAVMDTDNDAILDVEVEDLAGGGASDAELDYTSDQEIQIWTTSLYKINAFENK